MTRPVGFAQRSPGGEVRVAIIEPERLMRALMAEAVDRATGMRTVVVAGTCAEARARMRTTWMDVVAIEVDLPDGNGVTLALELQRADPQLSIVTVTRHDVRSIIETTERHLRRPWSHISKLAQSGASDLVETIRAAATGPDKVPGPRSSAIDVPDPFEALTAQQFAVLRLISEGFSNVQVAERLGLSRRTVENHLLAIYRAFAISSEEVNPRVSAVLRFLAHSIRY